MCCQKFAEYREGASGKGTRWSKEASRSTENLLHIINVVRSLLLWLLREADWIAGTVGTEVLTAHDKADPAKITPSTSLVPSGVPLYGSTVWNPVHERGIQKAGDAVQRHFVLPALRGEESPIR